MDQKVNYPATEETYEWAKGLKIFYRSWRPAENRAPSSSSATASIRTAASTSGRPSSSWRAASPSTRSTCAAAGSRTASASTSRMSPNTSATLPSVIKLAKSREPGLPVFLLGHSAGGVVSCVYTLEHQAELAGLICESFAFQVPAPDFALAAIKGLSRIAPQLPRADAQEQGLLARSRRRWRRLNSDPLIAHEVQPAITVAALVRADERLSESSRTSPCRC